MAEGAGIEPTDGVLNRQRLATSCNAIMRPLLGKRNGYSNISENSALGQ